ncbi:MAG: saccharopine dehydrogenase NADP-binding domain-containing protein [Anaerolineae bacterium]|nr:MAG: saccharopine dehydrogenase NADP-binding domain-containing protein [Anaerolineae bacterium]
MKILVLGSGLMGPASAFNVMSDPQVSQVALCDASQQQLDAAQAKLRGMEGSEKLTAVALDLSDQAAASQLMAGFDAVVAALPRTAIPFGIRAAVAAGKPLVDLSWPSEEALPALRQAVEDAGALVIPGCGVEPGLTEIMARHLAEKLDRVDVLHIKCGGIPEKPAPPLGYKIVFGGRQMPLREGDAWVAENGKLKAVPRYSGVEPVIFPGVGEVEAWHEGFMPWLLELEALKGLKRGSQKTFRWPGYAAKVTVLREMGLLSHEPVEVEGMRVAPKKVLDAVLYPRVRLEEGERDITLFRVEAVGEKQGQPRRYKIEMVDRYDEALGFTSMARTTAFTGAIVARMVARGDLKTRGFVTPEKVITGPLFEKLVEELAAVNVRFDVTTEKVSVLG